MRVDEARELFAYGVWANGQVFAAAEALTAEQLDAQVTSSFPSVRGTLGHIVGAEWIWLRRWRGESPSVAPAWATDSSLPELRDHLGTVEAERREFLSGLADVDLQGVIEYTTLAGQAHSDRLGELFRHVVNHSTYHRGQVATQLRQLGVTPPSTDLIRHLRLRK